jgi:hypothetical protein
VETIFISPFVHQNLFQFLGSLGFLLHFRKTELVLGSQLYLTLISCIHLFSLSALTGISYLMFRVTGWRWYSLYFYEPFRHCTFGFVPILSGVLMYDFDKKSLRTWLVCVYLVIFVYLYDVFFSVCFGIMTGFIFSFIIRDKLDKQEILKSV